jgi:methionyl aminopeptidase
MWFVFLKHVMAIIIKSAAQIELIKKSCHLLSEAMGEVAKAIKPGVTGWQLDKLAETYIRDHGGVPSFLGYDGFPGSLCISVNEAVVHGVPTDKPYVDGDIISVDCGVFMNNYHGDMAYTFGIGNVKEETKQLLRVTKQSLLLGIEQASAGKRTGDIGWAVQDYCEKKHPYKCVRELVGHGLGTELHEDPQVPNYGHKGQGAKLPENCVIAIEPMVNLGTKNVVTLRDKWTVVTQDGKPSAHFEHTILVKQNAPELLTTFEFIEAAIEANDALVKI